MSKDLQDSKVTDRNEWRARIQRALSDLRRLPQDSAGAGAGGASLGRPSPDGDVLPP